MSIFSFGLFRVVNSRISGVRCSFCLFLSSKYFWRYLMLSSVMKLGCLLNFVFPISCVMVILHELGGFGSKIFSTLFILSFAMVLGFSPDCLIIVKMACSLVWHFCVILLISVSVISVVSICFLSLFYGFDLWI